MVMGMNQSTDLHLARDGQVTWRNHHRLGYQRLSWGVYGHAPDTDGLDKWQARQASFITKVRAIMAAYVGKPVVLFGPTALQALGVALPTPLQDWDNCHVLVPAGCYRPERSGVVVHRTPVLPPRHRLNGLPGLHPVDHWVQLRHATIDQLVEVGDGLIRRRNPILSINQITGRLAELHDIAGLAKARRAAKWLAPGTDSLPETTNRLVFIHAGLPVPLVNFPIWCPNANWTYHGDMVFDKEKVIVEYDGAVHVKDHRQMQIDALRRRHLQEAGWLVITITADQLHRPDEIVRVVETALIQRRAALANAW